MKSNFFRLDNLNLNISLQLVQLALWVFLFTLLKI